MLQRGRLSRGVAALALVVFLPMTTVGCFGKFQLTRNLYGFNQDIDEDKWMRWFTFLVLSIIPIYAASVLIDVVLANSIEFWSDDNPIDPRTRRRFAAPDGRSVELVRLEDGRLEAVLEARDGSVEQRLYFERGPAGVTAWNADGRLLGTVRDVGGRPTLVAGAVAR